MTGTETKTISIETSLPPGETNVFSGRGTAWVSSSLSVLFGKGGQVISSLVLARVLSGEDFGAFILLLATANMLVGFLAYGLYSSSSHFLSEALTEGRAALRQSFWTILAAVLLLVILSIGLLYHYAGPLSVAVMKTPGLAGPLAFMLPAVASLTIVRALEGVLYGLRNFPAVAIIKGVAAPLGVFATILLGLRWGLSGAVAGFSAGACFLCVLMAGACFRRAKTLGIGPAMPSPAIGASLFRMTLVLSLTNMLVLLSTWAGQIILTRGAGLEAVGAFGVGNQLRNLLGLVPGTLGAASLPFMTSRYTRDGDAGLRSISSEYSMILLLVLGPACILLIGWSREILSLLYGPDMALAWSSANLLFLSLLVHLPVLVMAYVIISRGEPLYGMLVNLVWACVYLGTAWLITPRHGAWGLAASYLAANLVQVPFSIWYLKSRNIMIPGRLLKPFAVLLLGGLFTEWMALHGSPGLRFFLTPILALAGLLSVWHLGFDQVERSKILQKLVGIASWRKPNERLC